MVTGFESDGQRIQKDIVIQLKELNTNLRELIKVIKGFTGE